MAISASGAVVSLAFSDDGHHLATLVGDGTVRTWNLEALATELDRFGLGW